jgi:hypothetical protein
MKQGFYSAGATPVVRSIAYDPSIDRASMYTTYDALLSPGEPFPSQMAYGADLSPPVSQHVTNQGLTKATASLYNFGVSGTVNYTAGNLSAKPINRVYAVSRVRFVNGRREEGGLAALIGNPYDLVHEGDTATLDITIAPLDDQVTHIRVYRTLSGMDTGENIQNEMDTEWHLVAEIPLNGATNMVYVDGGAITTDPLDVQFAQQFHPPTITAEFFGLTDSGWFVCASRSGQVQISERYMPHAWPSENTLDLQETITDIVVHADNVYVGTEGMPYIIAISQGEKGVQVAATQYKEHYPCQSGSMTAAASGAIYASASGLVALSREGLQVITGEIANPGDKLFVRNIKAVDSPTEEAQKLVASFGTTTHGVYYRGKYYGFCGPLRADMFYLTTDVYDDMGYLTTLEYPEASVLTIWTAGDNVAQKYSPVTLGATPHDNYDNGNTINNLRVQHSTGRVFVPSANAVYIYETNGPNDPITAPVEIAFTQNMLTLSPYRAAIDEDTGTFTIVSGLTDQILLIFSDNTTQTINTGATTSPHMVAAMGDGKFAYWFADEGAVHVYGPSNAYAAPLVSTTSGSVFNVFSMAIDVDGQRLFLSNDDGYDIKMVDLDTGTVTSIDSGGRVGYRMVYNANLDRIIIDNFKSVGDNGKIFVIDPLGAPIETIDFGALYTALYPGNTFNNNTFKDMVMVGDTVAVLGEFTNGVDDYDVAIMLSAVTGLLLDEYSFSVGDNATSLTANTREEVYYIGISNWDAVPYMPLSGPPFAYNNIGGWLDSDNRFVTYI